MLRSLHSRLAFVLFCLLTVAGLVFVISTMHTTHRYQLEMDEALHRDLAWNIAISEHGSLLSHDGATRGEDIDELFHWLMVVNPRVEVYLLDTEGHITAFSAPPDAVQLEAVDIAPIERALESDDAAPIVGDDPRRPDQPTIFSVAPLPAQGPAVGYLYIVLTSQEADGAAMRLRGSYTLRLAVLTALGCVLLATLAGLFFFRRLTLPLRNLVRNIRRFGGLREHRREIAAGDEVSELETAVDRMRKRIEEQMAERERLDRHRRELIANVSHDLRTPLASLQGYLETLTLKGNALQADQRDSYLATALRQAERLGRRVRELFEFTRLETAAAILESETFSIAELVQDNIQRFALQASQAGVELNALVDGSVPWVEADLGLVERVLENLLENALRYTGAGGKVTIELGVGDDPHQASQRPNGQPGVTIRVRDTGCGIALEHLPFIFDRFYRQRDGGDSAGAGLGLAISQRIIALHHGNLEVTSKPGTGTCFSFTLPQARARRAVS